MNSNKRHQGNLAAIVAGTMAAAPVVEIKNFALAGAGLARITVEVTHNTASRADHSVVASAIEARLDGRMTAVAGSFDILEQGQYTDRLSGIVSVKRQAVPVGDTCPAGFRAMASNMFMDDESDMWVLRKTEAGGLLVKTTGIDDDMTLVGLLEANCSAGFRNSPDYGRVTASSQALANSVEGGQYVSYVTIDNLISHGFVVASVADSDEVVVLPQSGEEEIIKRAAVTEVHAQDDFPQVEPSAEEKVEEVVASARGEVDLSFLLEYYKKVFARSPAYFAAFAQRARSHQFC